MQEEVELPLEVPTPEPASKRRRRTRYPDDFRPTPEHFALAASLGVNLTREGPQFADHHRAKGSVMSDWNAALRTWIRNAAKYAARDSGVTSPGAAIPPPPRTDLYG